MGSRNSSQQTKPKEPTKTERLEKRNAELESANFQLKEQLVDSMRGEIEARRKLEAVRDYIAQAQQSMTQVLDSPDGMKCPEGAREAEGRPGTPERAE